MEKEYNLACVDYAIDKTVERSFEDSRLSELNTEVHFSRAIMEMMFNNNARGFTSAYGGRDYIKNLTRDDFEEILLKHVVKSKNAKQVLHKAQLLGVRKGFEDELTNQEVQELIYESLGTMHMASIKYLLDKYPNIYSSLIKTFVEERYFDKSLGIENLDKPMIVDKHNYYYKKIEEFYEERKYKNSINR